MPRAYSNKVLCLFTYNNWSTLSYRKIAISMPHWSKVIYILRFIPTYFLWLKWIAHSKIFAYFTQQTSNTMLLDLLPHQQKHIIKYYILLIIKSFLQVALVFSSRIYYIGCCVKKSYKKHLYNLEHMYNSHSAESMQQTILLLQQGFNLWQGYVLIYSVVSQIHCKLNYWNPFQNVYFSNQNISPM